MGHGPNLILIFSLSGCVIQKLLIIALLTLLLVQLIEYCLWQFMNYKQNTPTFSAFLPIFAALLFCWSLVLCSHSTLRPQCLWARWVEPMVVQNLFFCESINVEYWTTREREIRGTQGRVPVLGCPPVSHTHGCAGSSTGQPEGGMEVSST